MKRRRTQILSIGNSWQVIAWLIYDLRLEAKESNEEVKMQVEVASNNPKHKFQIPTARQLDPPQL